MQSVTSSASQVVVVAPAELELDIGDDAFGPLRAAVGSGLPVVIADLADTTFCDFPAFRQLVMLHGQAAARGVQLRVVLPEHETVRCWLEFLARQHLVRVYADLAAAMSAA
jgi:hypothetical protein